MVVILSVAQLVTTVIFFSACDKSHVKWNNSQKLTQNPSKVIYIKFIDTEYEHEPFLFKRILHYFMLFKAKNFKLFGTLTLTMY